MAKLYFRYGAMSSGKTSRLLDEIYNYEQNRNKKIFLIKPLIDTKGDDYIISRSGFKRKVDLLLGEQSVIESMNNFDYDAIFVDEAQFLKSHQVEELWYISKLKNIPVLCYGLRSTFQDKGFEGSNELLIKADTLEELATICSCGKKARFNVRYLNGEIITTGSEIGIDGNDFTYDSMCADCYIKKVLKKTL